MADTEAMRVEQVHLCAGTWSGPSALDADWLIVFAGPEVIHDPGLLAALRDRYPRAVIQGCSTAGEVLGARVFDDSAVATAVRFDHTRVRVADAELGDGAEAGRALAATLAGEDLTHVYVLAEGVDLNASALIDGLLAALPSGVTVSGGLAADGTRMRETAILTGTGVRTRAVAAAGLYGSRLEVGCGSLGGWDPFGPERIVTRAEGNVLYSLDDRSALELYERYLGDHAADLPTSGLLFPLAVRPPEGGAAVVRTLLAIDRAAGSITFAGDIPEGHVARLMHANYDRLIEGAAGAARACAARVGRDAELALAVSCVGRRIVLGQRIEEELDGLVEVLGGVPIAGFYSNGELGPSGALPCALHNQTMTVTTLRER